MINLKDYDDEDEIMYIKRERRHKESDEEYNIKDEQEDLYSNI